MCECNALLNVPLQAFQTGLEESLLILIEVGEWVIGLLGSAGLFRCQYDPETGV